MNAPQTTDQTALIDTMRRLYLELSPRDRRAMLWFFRLLYLSRRLGRLGAALCAGWLLGWLPWPALILGGALCALAYNPQRVYPLLEALANAWPVSEARQ